MRWKYFLGALFFFTASFLWGFFSHRNNLFPYSTLRDMALEFGVVDYHRSPVKPRSQQLAALSALPYLKPNPHTDNQRSGVTISSPKALQGYNFYNSWEESSAYLMDMAGETLHQWNHAFALGEWHHAELMPTGDILVVVKDHGVAKLSKTSKLIWYYATRAHHDLWIHDTGEIFVITREARVMSEIHQSVNTVFDKIVILSPEGQRKEEFSLLELLKESRYRYLLPSIEHVSVGPEVEELDILHTNHVEVFDGSQSHHSTLFKRGNILVSIRHINSIAIIDGDSREIVWLWGPTNIAMQHHPTVLENGNILIFDNGISVSRILELNPTAYRIAWSYQNANFHSNWGGANQRLVNGNTLVTDTAFGRAFEVTPEGEVVWEFVNPATNASGARINIWRVKRYQPTDLEFINPASN